MYISLSDRFYINQFQESIEGNDENSFRDSDQTTQADVTDIDKNIRSSSSTDTCCKKDD